MVFAWESTSTASAMWFVDATSPAPITTGRPLVSASRTGDAGDSAGTRAAAYRSTSGCRAGSRWATARSRNAPVFRSRRLTMHQSASWGTSSRARRRTPSTGSRVELSACVTWLSRVSPARAAPSASPSPPARARLRSVTSAKAMSSPSGTGTTVSSYQMSCAG